VLKSSVVEFPSRCFLVESRHPSRETADDLPDVPILPETLLAMELQLHACSVDLSAFTETVLGDLGATIQILRLAAREYGAADSRPVRIEDCISDLGLTACFHAAAGGPFVKGGHRRASFEIWTHSRVIANYCRLAAEEMPGSVNPDHAYLGGLFHALGALPAALGWQWNGMTGNRALTALKLAERWRFPGYVKDLFSEMLIPGYHHGWSKVLHVAHELASDSWARCPLEQGTVRSLA